MMWSLRAGALAGVVVCAATAQVAILQIQVVEGEGGVHPAGSRLARPIVVEISDEVGRGVSGAAVSFHLPEAGPGGTFASGLRTEVATTDDNGRAVLRGITFNRVPGRFGIRIIAVKEQTRAGTFSYQYIAEPKGGSSTARVMKHKRGAWIAVGLVAGATAVGILAGATRGSGSATPPPAAVMAPPAVPAVIPPTVGMPEITVGKP